MPFWTRVFLNFHSAERLSSENSGVFTVYFTLSDAIIQYAMRNIKYNLLKRIVSIWIM